VLDVTGGVATITLNRPDVLNSFNRAMALELRDALHAVRSDTAVRAVLLTGAGRAFCAGQDLAEVSPRPDGSLPPLGAIVHECYNPIIELIRTTEKPFVAAVNGVAAGAGANLALACDIVIAAKEAAFIQSFAKVGLIPDSGGTFILPRLVGLARATALTFLGEKLSAERAVEIGLIYRAVDGAELVATSRALAEELARMPTVGLGLTKRAFNAAVTSDLTAQLAREEELQAIAGRTDDYRIGVTSFLEKKKPVFTGK
jgi:2-(1,2-epoxy-1,2-dihydrophenyl)acetyl-CoA isomerase